MSDSHRHRKVIREAALALHKSASEVRSLPDSRYAHQGEGYRAALSLSLRAMARICEQHGKSCSVVQIKRLMLDAPAPQEYRSAELLGYRHGRSGGLDAVNRLARYAGITELNATLATFDNGDQPCS